MDILIEANRHISSSSDAEVERYGDEGALSDRIKEWLETPVGTLADIPSWGHNLSSFKFDPTSVDLAVAIELAIVEKMTTDIRDLVFLGIRVSYPEIDKCELLIRHQFGTTVTELVL